MGHVKHAHCLVVWHVLILQHVRHANQAPSCRLRILVKHVLQDVLNVSQCQGVLHVCHPSIWIMGYAINVIHNARIVLMWRMCALAVIMDFISLLPILGVCRAQDTVLIVQVPLIVYHVLPLSIYKIIHANNAVYNIVIVVTWVANPIYVHYAWVDTI